MRPGTRHNEETRARMSARRRALLLDPEFQQRLQERAQRPEAREQRNLKISAYWRRRREGQCKACAGGKCLLCDGEGCTCPCAEELDRPHRPMNVPQPEKAY